LGIIEKQTIKGTVYAYVGVVLGFINTGLLLPNIISAAENGLLGLLNSYGVIFSLVAGLGFNSTIIRMFTYFRNEKNDNNGFVFILSVVTLVGMFIAIGLYIAFRPIIYRESIDQSALFLEYFFYTIPLLIAYHLFTVLDNYFTVLYNATIGLFLNEFVKRVFFSIAIALFYFKWISFDTFVILYIAAFFVPIVVMLFMLIRSGQFSFKPNFEFLTKNLIRNMVSVSLFSFIGSFAGIVVMRVDVIMLSAMISLSGTGIYTITYFFGTLIKIPARPLAKIASAMYADAWKNDNIKFIQDIYRKSVVNQVILGTLLFIGVWANIPNIFQILPAEYEQGKYVVLYMGLASLLEMFSGANSVIISTSEDYKVITYLTIVLMVLTVATNYWLIPIYGITGAALASFISTFIYMLLRYLFLLIKYKLQPYDIKTPIIIGFAALTYGLSLLMPPMFHHLLDIFVRSSLISIIFALLIIVSKVSPELNKALLLYFTKLKRRINN
jgi:O-antigen/teichoic acid export membrane protein